MNAQPQTKTVLKTQEDWDEYFKKNKAFAEKIQKIQHTYADMSDQDFKNFIADMTVEELKIYVSKMKGEMLFYKNVINEPYYHDEKHRGVRFENSKKRYESINSKGKIISQLIKSKS